MFHITEQENRASIFADGLLPVRPDGFSEARRQSNTPAVYLFDCATRARRWWHRDTRFDVWQVDTDGLCVQSDPKITGAFRVPGPVIVQRLTLVG